MGRRQPAAAWPRTRRAFAVEAVALEALAKGLALEQLEDDVGDAGLESHVEDGKDVRVVERARRTRLVLEAAPALGARRIVGGDDLERDLAPEPWVVGAVDLAHAARSQGGSHLVTAET